MREYRIGREHRVLLRPEAREPVAHERLKRRDRFGPGDGELPRAVAAGQPDLPGPLPFVQVPTDFPVGPGPDECGLAAELGRPMAERGQHQVGALPVHGPAPERGP